MILQAQPALDTARIFAAVLVLSALALALYAPKTWRNVRAGAVVYAFGTVLTWLIPSQVGSNVDRLALLFGGAVMLAAAMERKTAILYVAFAATAVSQIIRPVFYVVNTGSPDGNTTGVLAVAYVDVVGPKAVNDSRGHDAVGVIRGRAGSSIPASSTSSSSISRRRALSVVALG